MAIGRGNTRRTRKIVKIRGKGKKGESSWLREGGSGEKKEEKNNDKTEREVRKYREGNEVKQNRKKRKLERSWLKEGTEEKRKSRKGKK